MKDVLERALMLLDGDELGALATVVATRGSAPQVPGARMLLCSDGRCVGTVGGGRVEAHVKSALERVLAGGGPQLLDLDLGRDLGMSCGGSMQVFLEPLERPRLLVCGAGHVAAPTARFARDVGFRVTVIDERADLNVPERFPDCRLIVAEPAVAAASLPARADDFVLFLGPSHAHDLSALRAFAQRPHRYLGLMGSLRKVLSIVRTLRAEGLELPLDRLYAPVGVALGATTPQEIAVSIVAELIALRRGETPRHLRALDDPRVRDRFMGG